MNTKNHALRWGVLGTGRIARTFIAAVAESKSGTVVASASRHAESAAAFQSEFPDLRCYSEYSALLDDDALDAIYVATPHPFHKEWAARALERGIPVLCEKPMTMNANDTRELVATAERSGAALVEAFRYRFHPQTHRVCQLLAEGAIGELRVINASFCGRAPHDPKSRLFDPTLGASAILDIGCYVTSISRLFAGAAAGLAFEDPRVVRGSLVRDPEHRVVDLTAVAGLEFPSGAFAQIRCSIETSSANRLELLGTEGSIEIATPFACAPAGKPADITLTRQSGVEPVEITTPLSAMAHEALAFADLVTAGGRESDHMSWADSIGNAETMDAWRGVAGA